jgi:predicted deacylase
MHISEFELSALPNRQRHYGWLEVATRADGSAWRLPLLTVTGEEQGPVLVVTAGVHGDEYEGIEAIAEVYRRVTPSELRESLIMMPVCNMPAYEAGSRSSPIDGLNLARVKERKTT